MSSTQSCEASLQKRAHRVESGCASVKVDCDWHPCVSGAVPEHWAFMLHQEVRMLCQNTTLPFLARIATLQQSLFVKCLVLKLNLYANLPTVPQQCVQVMCLIMSDFIDKNAVALG